MARSPCPECGSSDLHKPEKPVSSGGGYAPDLLPGLSSVFKSGKLDVVLCGNCGLIRLYARREALERLRSSKKWDRVP